MDKTKVKVEFTINSKDDNFIPSYITELFGIQPSLQRIKGGVIKKTPKVKCYRLFRYGELKLIMRSRFTVVNRLKKCYLR